MAGLPGRRGAGTGWSVASWCALAASLLGMPHTWAGLTLVQQPLESGQALYASGMTEVVVDGQRAEVDAKGNFQTVVPLNDTRTLEIRATDTHGNRRQATITILRYAP